MFKTIAIALLTLALGGAGYFAFIQKSAYGQASKEVAALEEKLKEAEKKNEEATGELKAALSWKACSKQGVAKGRVQCSTLLVGWLDAEL